MNLAVRILVGVGIALGWHWHAGATDERERALVFLAATGSELPACSGAAYEPACQDAGFADIDGDGAHDCWRLHRDEPEHHDRSRRTLTVWPGCRGEAVMLGADGEGMTMLAIPPRVAAPAWLRWIAAQLTDGEVECSAPIAGCPAAGPQWQWVLASATHRGERSTAHGGAAPVWQPRDAPHWRAGALIVPHADADWFPDLAISQFRNPPRQPAGARIVVDRGQRERAAPIACGGITAVTVAGGIVGVRPGDRAWTWLFRGLAPRGGYGARTLRCVDGLLVASTAPDSYSAASIVAIEPASGGWIYEPGNDCCDGATIEPSPAGAMWQPDGGPAVSMRRLATWLAEPPARRSEYLSLAR